MTFCSNRCLRPTERLTPRREPRGAARDADASGLAERFEEKLCNSRVGRARNQSASRPGKRPSPGALDLLVGEGIRNIVPEGARGGDDFEHQFPHQLRPARVARSLSVVRQGRGRGGRLPSRERQARRLPYSEVQQGRDRTEPRESVRLARRRRPSR